MFNQILVVVTLLVVCFFVWMESTKEETLNVVDSIDKNIEEIRKDKKLSQKEEDLLRLQLAVVNYVTDHSNPPNSLSELVPKYIISIPTDPKTSKPYAYKRMGKSYQIGEPRKNVQLAKNSNASNASKVEGSFVKNTGVSKALSKIADGTFINPNEMQDEEFRYNQNGTRDPFLVFDFSKKTKRKGTGTPLENYSLGQLRVTAIIKDLKGNRKAIVEDSAGRGYTVTKGTKIGDQGGYVVVVNKNSIKVLETFTDITGRETTKVTEMEIYAGG